MQTWKCILAGFLAGVLSTGAYTLGFETVGIVGWALSIGYIVYKALEKE